MQSGAGLGSSISDEEFVAAGARMLPTADDVWGYADLILKVKEPIAEEYGRMRQGQILFTYLHLAASRECTDALLNSGVTAIAYETVELADGSLPLLAPMSEVAGRMAPQVGAYALQRANGGRGVLMGGVSGVYAAKVVVIGAGVSGLNAAAIALGMQAEVLLLDKNIARLRQVDAIYQGHMQTVASNAYEIEKAVLDADLVIGAVLVPGAKAPTLVSNDLVSRMKKGSVLVDIAIDQGGCFETSRPTTHADPTYEVDGVVHYCVTNMPAAVARTATEVREAAEQVGYPLIIKPIAGAGSHRTNGAVAIGVGDSTDDSYASSVTLPTQVVVHMPLHQVASEIKQSRVVNGDSGFGDKHRGYKRALVAINFVHKRFGG